MGYSLEEIEKEKAEKRMKATQFKPGNVAKSEPNKRVRLSYRSSSREGHRSNEQSNDKDILAKVHHMR